MITEVFRANGEKKLGMNDKEALTAIGQLIKKGRVALDESQSKFAERAGLNSKTLWSAETGARQTQDVNQLKIERALGWRHGAIAEIWNDRDKLTPDQLTLAEMSLRKGKRDGQETEVRERLVSAQSLSDEELLAEISYRFRKYKTAAVPGS